MVNNYWSGGAGWILWHSNGGGGAWNKKYIYRNVKDEKIEIKVVLIQRYASE